jgi:hypothetical protein
MFFGVGHLGRQGIRGRASTATGGPPSLTLDFMTPGSLDPLIQFTRASNATYFDSAGVLQTATTNTPRWNYDPVTHALKGLLLEDERTNLCPHHLPHSANGWGPNGTTTTAGGGISPTGANDMVKVAETATLAFHICSRIITVTANTTYTMSVYAKAAERQYLCLFADDNAGTFVGATFDLLGGTITDAVRAVGGAVANNSTMQHVGNGIYRCTVSGIASTSSANWRFVMQLSDSPSSIKFQVYQGVAGSGLLLWGAQLELNDFPTSLIMSAGAASTRSIDQCFIPPANMGWFNGVGGSWLAEFDFFDITPQNNRIIGRPNYAGGHGAVTIGTTRVVGQYDMLAGANAPGTATQNTVTRACTTWAAPSTGRSCLDGGGVGIGTTMTNGYATYATTGIRFMSVGAALSTDNGNGHMRKMQYWSRILSDAEMQSATTALDLNFMVPGTLDSRITFTRTTTGTYTDPTGVIRTAAVNEPRWDYDPVTRQLRGLLLEEARTNILPFGVPPGGWGVSNATMVGNSGTAPDGTNSFVKVIPTTTTAQHSIQNVRTASINTQYCCSVYAKAGEMRYLQIILDDLAGGTPATMVTFDLQTGVISSNNQAGRPVIQDVGNGVYRCSTWMQTSATATQVRFGLVVANIPNPSFYVPTWVGDDVSGLYVWGTQMEVGTFPTSYIPTTSAAVLRAGDVCQITGASFSSWFISSAGTIVEEVSFPAVVGGMNVRLSEFSDGTTTNFLTLSPSFSGAYALSSTIAGVPGTALSPLGTTTAGQVMRLGYTYGVNRTAVVNGGTVVSTPGGIAPSVNQLQFGNRPDGVRGGIIHVRSMKFWSRAFSDAELQTVTT